MPKFSEMTKSEFLKGLQDAKNDPEAFFEAQTKDLDPSSDGYQQKLFAEKRAFLIHCINSDIDEPTFAQNLRGNQINWNPGQEKDLSDAADQLYPSDEKGTDGAPADPNAQYKMTDLFLGKAENDDAKLLDQIITHFSPLDLWEKKYRIREAFIGERLLSNTASQESKTEHLQEISTIKRKLTHNVSNILDNDYIDNGVDDEYISLDDDEKPNVAPEEKAPVNQGPNPIPEQPKSENPGIIPQDASQPREEIQKEQKPAGPVIIEDPKSGYRIERILLPEENAKEALLEKLTEKAPSGEIAQQKQLLQEKESWLYSYLLSDLSDEDFKKKVTAIKQNQQLSSLAGNIVKAGTLEGFREKLFTQKFENRVKEAFTTPDSGAMMSLAMQAGSLIIKHKESLEKEAEEKRQNALREKQQAEQKAQEEKIQQIKFDVFVKLDALERIGISGVYDEIYKIQKKAALPDAGLESKAQSKAADTYIKDMLSDPKRADAFYRYAAEQKAHYFYQAGIAFDQELNNMKSGYGLWEPFRDFAQDAEMSSAVVSMLMYSNTKKTKSEIDALEQIESLLPDKQKFEQYTRESISQLTSYIGSPEAFYQKGSQLKAGAKKAEALGFVSNPIKKYPVITEAAKEELASRKKEPAAAAGTVRKQTNKETIRSYNAALEKFNTSRASFFKQESRTHERARLAAETLRDLRTQLDITNPSSHFVKLSEEKKQREFAKKWLDAANTLSYESKRYISKKSPLTFAGRDRKAGAVDLKKLAANEIRLCENAITARAEKTDFTVKDIYLDIAKEKLHLATDAIRNADFSLPEGPLDGKSVADQMKEKKESVKQAICDAVAASASQKQLGAGDGQNTAANYYALRRHLEQNALFQQAVTAYLDKPENWGKNMILQDLENGAANLVSKLQTSNKQLNVEHVIAPQNPRTL